MAEEDKNKNKMKDSRKYVINSNSSTETVGSANTNPTISTPQPHHHQHHDDGEDGSSGWLRLGIGCSAPDSSQPKLSSPGPSMLELNLLPGGATLPLPPPPLPPVFYYRAPQQWVVNHNHSSVNGNYFRMVTPVISNYTTLTQPGTQFLLQQRLPSSTTTSFQSHPQHQPMADPLIRLVDPPRRPLSGIWFLLQPSLNQSKQPFLPQLPKNYLRIKDGRMTVRFLLKYLVNKLGLESESEVEIRCRGEQLEGSLTMQHVRDEIWGHHVRELAASSPVHHLMILHYARSS